MLKKSQVSYTVNVCVKEIDKITHKVYNEIKGSNRATRNALYGIIKFINGEFNPSISDYINSVNKFIPRYVALGKGSSAVTVNDSSLGNEYLVNSQPYRIRINDSEVVNNRNNPYMKLITKTYISDDYFDNNEFTELGLFSTEKSQSCWARVVMDRPFKKLDTTVLEITWEITIISPSGEDDYKMDYVKEVSYLETPKQSKNLYSSQKSSAVSVNGYEYLVLDKLQGNTFVLYMYPIIDGVEQDEIDITTESKNATPIDVSSYDEIKFKVVGSISKIYFVFTKELPEEDSYSYSLYIDGTRDSITGITNNKITYTKHDYTGAVIDSPHTFDINIDDETGELKINDITIINEY